MCNSTAIWRIFLLSKKRWRSAATVIETEAKTREYLLGGWRIHRCYAKEALPYMARRPLLGQKGRKQHPPVRIRRLCSWSPGSAFGRYFILCQLSHRTPDKDIPAYP